ncbi:MAG: hypothetical protein JNL67_09300 [Planctomycetaceae bacterium]|nr:hypothetical protein [Planctomycetaceae bacterium]
MLEINPNYNAYTLFPWSLAEDVIRLAKERGATFRTFGQTKLCKSLWNFSPKLASRLEFLTASPWNAIIPRIRKLLPGNLKVALRGKESLKGSLEVYFHHDADRQPYKTLEMIQLENRLGVVSSNYFFFERHIWDADAEEYIVPAQSLTAFESEGFEIGYHLNAYELANYDLDSAIRIMEHDVAWFRARFSLKSYVPHGGVPGPNGLNNNMMPQVGSLKNLLWAYNRYGVFCDTRWSDGDIRNTAPKDPREVIRSATKGSRISFLMHPQYYGTSLCENYREYAISKSDWWRKLWDV